ncbi:MAG: hypothetical protein AMXMBFR33_31610 [Candidatus Xenobia bacterium]
MKPETRGSLLVLLWTGIAAMLCLLFGGEAMSRVPLVAFAPPTIGLALMAASLAWTPQSA